MPIAKLDIGRFKGVPRATDGSQDTSPWKLLTTSDIIATSDPNGLEVSKTMSGKEFQFRGSAPVGASLDNPDDGCLYRFNLTDPASGSVLDAGSGEIVGIQFWFQLGTNVPDAENEQFVAGVWDTTVGFFAGLKRDSTQQRVAYGSYTGTAKTAFTIVAGYVYEVEVFLADDSADTSAVSGLPRIVVYDDPSTPARVQSLVSGSQSTTISGTATDIALVFAGDIDVTIYYRLIRPATNPF
jgi:hypothetical protein